MFHSMCATALQTIEHNVCVCVVCAHCDRMMSCLIVAKERMSDDVHAETKVNFCSLVQGLRSMSDKAAHSSTPLPPYMSHVSVCM